MSAPRRQRWIRALCLLAVALGAMALVVPAPAWTQIPAPSVPASAAAAATAGRHVLWRVRGPHHSVWLLGSIHMLTAGQSLLPDVADAAYVSSNRLLVELDPTTIGAQSTTADVRERVRLPEGFTLSALLGPFRYERVGRVARSLGIEPAMLAQAQPWYAATTLDAVHLARLGFDPDRGVDMQLARRAHADGKPILELESVAEQFGFFSQLTFREQIRYLDSTLRDLPDTRSEAHSAVQAWRNGDLVTLERQLARSQHDSPAMHAVLITDRNRRWVPRLEALIDDEGGDCLVVVGALHLVGKDGVVALLRARGRSVERH